MVDPTILRQVHSRHYHTYCNLPRRYRPSSVLFPPSLQHAIMSLQIATELKPRLSHGAGVVVPGDEEFANLASRWREWHAPTVAAIVQVVTESDVQEAVSNTHHSVTLHCNSMVLCSPVLTRSPCSLRLPDSICE